MSSDAEWRRTARVLRRAGFGASGAEVDSVVKVGVDEYIAAAIVAGPDDDPGVRATPPPDLGTPAAPVRTSSQLRAGVPDRTFTEQIELLGQWWIQRLVAVRNPLVEKLTWTWHDHFATSAAKVRNAPAMLAQNQTLRAGALGNFAALLNAMISDPALVFWLDGQFNTVPAPNEHFARALLERFAVGLGHFAELDVRELARALTGLKLTNLERVRFDPFAHDTGGKTILGATGDFGPAKVAELVATAPGSAQFVAGTLWLALASDAAPRDAVLGRIVDAYGPRRSIGRAVAAIFADEEFDAAYGTVVNSPVEWIIGAVRALKIPVSPERAKLVLRTLEQLGQSPFFPPDTGWPRGAAWISTATIPVRVRTAQVLAESADLSALESAGRGERVDAVGHLLGIGAFSDASAKVLGEVRGDVRMLVARALNSPEYLTS